MKLGGLDVPEPLFSCHDCGEDYSWPAVVLYWSEVIKDWVCLNCWHDEDGERGVCLRDHLEAHIPEWPWRKEEIFHPHSGTVDQETLDLMEGG